MTFANPIVGGTTLIRPAIHSPDYVAGVSGWSINKDGTAEFTDVVIRGGGTTDTLVVGTLPNPQVIVGATANVGVITLPTNRPIENQPASILVGPVSSGLPSESASLQINGPSVDGATDRCRIFLNSQNNDGSSNANMSLTTGSSALIIDETVGTFDGQRLSVFPDASANNAFHVNADLGHTGNLVRISKASTDMFVVDTDGVMRASNRVTGVTSITPSAPNVPTSVNVVFPTPLTGTTFTCQVTPNTSAPGTAVTGVSYNGLSSTGVTLWLTRTAVVTTGVSYTVEGF